MKKFLLLIVICSLAISCGNKDSSKKEPELKIEVGKDYVPNQEFGYVFKSYADLSEASSAINANDQKGFQHILFDDEKTIIIPDSVKLRVYSVKEGFCEVRISNGDYVHEKGFIFSTTLKLAN